MRMRHAVVVAGLLVGLTSGEASAASFTVTYSQTAAGVLAIATGDFATDQLSFKGTFAYNSGVQPNAAFFGFGTDTVGDEYSGHFDGPGSFGSGNYTSPTTSTGDDVLFNRNYNLIAVPSGYNGGTLNASELFSDATFISLGMTPGTYTWTYGGLSEGPLLARAAFTDPFTSTITVQVGPTLSTVPLPASAPMFGAALVALGAVGYGMRRKKAAAV